MLGCRVACAGPADGAVALDDERGLIVDAATVTGCVARHLAPTHDCRAAVVEDTGAGGDIAMADGHARQGDTAGAAATGAHVKHTVHATTVDDGVGYSVAVDS